MPDQRYSREEVDAILGRAIERERNADGLSHEELLSVAREVGVSQESLERAAAEIARERREALELAEMRSDARRGFISHLIPFVCVNTLLLLINYATTRFPWALFPILGWGMGLMFHLRAALFPSRERLERLLARKQQRRRRREINHELRASAKQFESAVGQGVATLLKVAAEKVNETAATAQRRPDERVRVNADKPRARPNDAQVYPLDNNETEVQTRSTPSSKQRR